MTATYTESVMLPEPQAIAPAGADAFDRPDHPDGARDAPPFDEAVAPLGLRARHLVALTHLSDHGPTAQQTLIEALGLDASNLVALLNELEDADLIVRKRDSNDRRRGIIELSPEGERVLHTSIAPSRPSTTRCSRRSARDERETLNELLARASAPLCEQAAECAAAEAAEECDPTC